MKKKYILFNTINHDFNPEEIQEFKHNITLYTALMLFKDTVEKNIKILNKIFDFWGKNDFIENEILFPYEYDFTHTLENDTSFVGYEITTPTDKEILNIINKIVLTFDAVDTVKILLFHSSKKAPIKSIEIETTPHPINVGTGSEIQIKDLVLAKNKKYILILFNYYII